MDTNEMRLILDNKALVDLSRLCETLHVDHARELTDCINRDVQWMVRVSAYINARKFLNMDHIEAVNYSNRKIKDVRRALGYAYPEDNIYF